MKKILSLFFAAAIACGAAELHFAGYLGNSGTAEKPVLFGKTVKNNFQVGPVFDPSSGRLYAAAGSGRVNAYTVDGRMVASYKIPEGAFTRFDTMTRCGDDLVFLLGGKLYKLPLNAPEGSAAMEIKHDAGLLDSLSSSSRSGKVAVHARSNGLFLLDPATGKTEKLGDLPAPYLCMMDWNSKGELFMIIQHQTAYKVENGAFVQNEEWPRRISGNREPSTTRGRFLDGYFYSFCGGDTIKRMRDTDFEPQPGVIFGGASGHFLGYVFTNHEVDLPGSIEELTPGVFAAGGGRSGIIHIVKWDETTQRLVPLRRIGALPEIPGLAMDAQGRILAGRAVWSWNDDPRTPLATNVPGDIESVGQLSQDAAVLFGEHFGMAAVGGGALLERRLGFLRQSKKWSGAIRSVGACGYFRPGKGNVVFQLDETGKTRAGLLAISSAKMEFQETPPVEIRPAEGIKKYSSVAALDDRTLLVAADGRLLVCTPDGDHWKESRRWQTSFESGFKIAVSQGKVCISEKEKNRLALYDFSREILLAETEVAAPTHVAINGGRIAVYESGNQRVVKFNLH